MKHENSSLLEIILSVLIEFFSEFEFIDNSSQINLNDDDYKIDWSDDDSDSEYEYEGKFWYNSDIINHMDSIANVLIVEL